MSIAVHGSHPLPQPVNVAANPLTPPEELRASLLNEKDIQWYQVPPDGEIGKSVEKIIEMAKPKGPLHLALSANLNKDQVASVIKAVGDHGFRRKCLYMMQAQSKTNQFLCEALNQNKLITAVQVEIKNEELEKTFKFAFNAFNANLTGFDKKKEDEHIEFMKMKQVELKDPEDPEAEKEEKEES